MMPIWGEIVELICDNCNGVGGFDNFEIIDEDSDGDLWEECTECHGSGVIEV